MTNEPAILHQLQHQPRTHRDWLYQLVTLNLISTDTEHEECPFIISMLDEFKVKGLNGTHRCIVTELLGPSVAAVKECSDIDSTILPVNMGRPLVVQVAKSVAFLHLHGSCMLIESSHQPKYLVCLPSVSKFWALCNSSAPNIRVLDFGESFYLPFKFSGQVLPGTPEEFAAPELLLNLPGDVSKAIGIWALGYAIYQLLGSGSLFFSLGGSSLHYVAPTLWLCWAEKRQYRRGSEMRSAKRARCLTWTTGG
ncbi:hypothetical protein BDD12DRAFT_808653 [Trichophaea hybrida]|nr:hypothetical protein BDD12DRAFT_808653 [Trichophaea hybrida]